MSKKQTLLSILKAVDYSQTISDIAERLYMSQPYISKVLKEAEQQYGVKLVQRHSKPIALTQAGVTMIKGLQSIVSAEEQLTTQLAETKAYASRPINVLITDPFLSTLVCELVVAYYAQHPTVKINIASATEQPIDGGAPDLVIGKQQANSDYQTLALPVQQLYVFGTQHCENFDPNRVMLPYQAAHLSRFNQYRYIGLSSDNAFQEYVDLSFKKEGIDMCHALTVPTVVDALKTAQLIPKSGTITTWATARSTCAPHTYNLMPLPQRLISITDELRIMTSGPQVVALAQALQQQLTASLTADLQQALEAGMVAGAAD